VISAKRPIVSQMEAASIGPVGLATPESISILPALPVSEVPQRQEAVDIIICVHNALDDVRQCLHSVIEKTSPPYRLIIVDDGSGEATRDYLADFAGIHDTLLLRNEQALGYTFAANIGLRVSNAPWVVLLNSDTVVTEPWMEAMWRHGWRDPNVGVIGPLSNAASWQSVPHIRAGDDWAINNLPDGMTPQDVADSIGTVAVGAREMPFLNGFCYMIRRAVIDKIGLFDETAFGGGYGEENDYSIRTRQAGYKLIVATDAYVFHAHSSSYTSERRRELAKQADVTLVVKHDPARHIYSQVQYCASSPVFTSVRARVQAALRRRELIEEGRRDFEGRRIAFILPVVEYGGGANVVLQEARALNSMGVDVAVLNLSAFVQQLAKYGIPEVPRFISCLDEIEIRKHIEETNVPYDGVIATAYSSMYWLPDKSRKDTKFGYYIQDYEPRFFPETDPRHSKALATYSLRDDVRLFTKTAWNQQAVADATKSVPEVIGCSLDLNLFAPAEERAMAPKDRPVRIAAMLRPSTPRRAPARTLAVLNEIVRRYPDRVGIHAFGGTDEELHSSGLHQPWITNHGPLHPTRLAKLLGSCDIFVDFSDYQAMGLTLLESMASGCAAIGPIEGGATSFVQSGVNGFLVDTASLDECIEKTDLLVRDADLRMNLQHQAIEESSRHIPEAAALNILRCLFQ
jgi:GT2 family glycosyltransferase